MDWLSLDEAVFYGAVWAIGFLSSLFSRMGSAGVESGRKCLFIGGVSGFLAFAAVTILCGRVSEPLVGHWYYLGVAALIGLLGNQQEIVRQRLVDFLTSGLGNEKR